MTLVVSLVLTVLCAAAAVVFKTLLKARWKYSKAAFLIFLVLSAVFLLYSCLTFVLVTAIR